jgi:cysteine synthase
VIVPANNVQTNILDHVGNTPLVEIKNIEYNPNTKILAKLESFNPGGSVKDRIAKRIIEQAEKKGELTKNKTIIEATSGNTGIGLALVSKLKSYRTVLVMPESVSKERIDILRGYGSEVVLTTAEEGVDGAINYVDNKIREHPEKYFQPDQFNNPENVLAHYHGTGLEIANQSSEVVDYFVAGMGTGGTLMGAGKKLKEIFPNIEVVGVEPCEKHKIQGLKNMTESMVPGIFKREQLDEVVNVNNEEAFRMTRELLLKEGLFFGLSSGAAMTAAVKKSWEIRKGVIVVIFPDGGAKYLSTGVFSNGDEQ